ncbi:bleomycin resistance protein [Rhodoplanes serenus]|jgi:catechol 2,3-dioxygenase-like lactoylglutathione lyase family enzyme|uniref:Bleomycin resistance protein n=1 Tax=Rhodoplanes serenus TaxID=200615 RepID=A0A327KA10_9BRAD|nr:bleomycin resistance protein [Rhodoplanes serenus]MTW16660.1 bleomycin resistance protein [Rhodoplanes serenus]RAI35227.1 bleomycin resistance protein [Rhodoplanes serenus]
MADHATPNLPSRDFDATVRFYGRLGFAVRYRDAGWLILEQGGIVLEFFPHPDLDPLTSWFSCCLRLDDLPGFYARCTAADIPEARQGCPRLHAPQAQPWGGTMAALIDPDGTLVRLIQNEADQRQRR